MDETGTQEAKRARKAAPPALEQSRAPVGCLFGVILYVAVCAARYVQSRWAGSLVFAAPGAALLAGLALRYLYGVALLVMVRRTWTGRGVRCLLIHSDSAAWEGRIRTRWLPRIGDIAVTLNWSQRHSWHSTLAVRVFKRFCGTRRNFNPAVIVFRGLRRPYVFRFFYAFQEVKTGRPQYLERLEVEMFDALRLDAAS